MGETLLYHYTVGKHIGQIITEGVIRPATAGTPDPQAVIKRLADTKRLPPEENVRAAQKELSSQGEDLTSKPPGETPAATAKATSDYPRLVEQVKAAPRSRPKLIEQMKAQPASPEEDLTQQSLERVLKRKR